MHLLCGTDVEIYSCDYKKVMVSDEAFAEYIPDFMTGRMLRTGIRSGFCFCRSFFCAVPLLKSSELFLRFSKVLHFLKKM